MSNSSLKNNASPGGTNNLNLNAPTFIPKS
jgi:hypothetical protein